MNYQEHLRRVYFVYMDIENAPVYVTNAGHSLYWNNIEWLGVGALGSISGLGENTDMSASQITLGLSGVANDLVKDITKQDYQERLIQVFQNDMTANYQVESSTLVWEGLMDTASFELGETAFVNMDCESALARWNRSSPRRMNDTQQQKLYAGDRGMEYVASSENVSIVL